MASKEEDSLTKQQNLAKNLLAINDKSDDTYKLMNVETEERLANGDNHD